MNATAHGAAEQVPEQMLPLDLQTMRETALRALGKGSENLSQEELDSLTRALRGMLALAIPEVTAAADKHPQGDVPRICALVGVEEASRHLRARPVPAASPWAPRQAQRLARSVMALTDHYVNLGGRA
ncbi:DUF6415 family natural product biosynthesis protein [Streptomyces filamentosus]|uniref:DUF6415 family natural product biosynthesis protein n=1 Tax=Streptomyces filamentosus TaxID=67294 RepID=UPI0012390C85|nr:DUF6415 family natural product biosynthesis protein [Streptomyces filamentosus]KAA6218935.1 hypothetical protein CP979_20130 [Streptomyces filamentosus]